MQGGQKGKVVVDFDCNGTVVDGDIAIEFFDGEFIKACQKINQDRGGDEMGLAKEIALAFLALYKLDGCFDEGKSEVAGDKTANKTLLPLLKLNGLDLL